MENNVTNTINWCNLGLFQHLNTPLWGTALPLCKAIPFQIIRWAKDISLYTSLYKAEHIDPSREATR